MFIGHFGLGFAGKKAAPSVSLGTLFLSVQLADGLWPLFLVLGLEHVRIVPGIMKLSPFDFYDYPISHSLVALIGWGIVVGAVYLVVRRNVLGAAVLAAGVVSPWVLDFAVHRPDMPVMPRGPYLGLGLWNSIPDSGFRSGMNRPSGDSVRLTPTLRAAARAAPTLGHDGGLRGFQNVGAELGPARPVIGFGR